jgi:hypothetical protein
MKSGFKPHNLVVAFLLTFVSAGYLFAQTYPKCGEKDPDCVRMEKGTVNAEERSDKLTAYRSASRTEDRPTALPSADPQYRPTSVVPMNVRNEKTLIEDDKADAQKQAEQDPESLRKAAQNPIASLISVPFQNNTSFALGPDNDRTQNVLVIQPVIPVRLTPSVNMIMRFVTPIVYQPNFIVPQTPAIKTGWFGLGDINPSFFFSPTKVNKVIWGVGPTFVLPTATSTFLGQGKLQVGPTFVWLVQPGKWTFGSLFNNTWSVAGKSSRRSTNQGIFQYFVNYNLKKGYFLTWNPTITFNWKEKGAGRWTVPFGGGVGRIMLLGKQPVNVSVQAFANPVRPPNSSPFTLRFSFTLLYPKRPS